MKQNEVIDPQRRETQVSKAQDSSAGPIIADAQRQVSSAASKSGAASVRTLSGESVEMMHPYYKRTVGSLVNPADVAHFTPKTPPPAPQLPSQLGPFQTGYIAFDNGVPVGGTGSLTLYQNGNYDFSGHFHDSGWPSYKVELAWLFTDASGRGYTFDVQGNTYGTEDAGSRDFSWTQDGSNDQIAANWSDLCQSWTYSWTANANWDGASAVDSLVNAAKVAGTVIGVVIAVVAAVA